MKDTLFDQQNSDNNQISEGGFLYLISSTVGTSGPHVNKIDKVRVQEPTDTQQFVSQKRQYLQNEINCFGARIQIYFQGNNNKIKIGALKVNKEGFHICFVLLYLLVLFNEFWNDSNKGDAQQVDIYIIQIVAIFGSFMIKHNQTLTLYDTFVLLIGGYQYGVTTCVKLVFFGRTYLKMFYYIISFNMLFLTWTYNIPYVMYTFTSYAYASLCYIAYFFFLPGLLALQYLWFLAITTPFDVLILLSVQFSTVTFFICWLIYKIYKEIRRRYINFIEQSQLYMNQIYLLIARNWIKILDLFIDSKCGAIKFSNQYQKQHYTFSGNDPDIKSCPDFNDGKDQRDYCLTMAMAVCFGLYPLNQVENNDHLSSASSLHDLWLEVADLAQSVNVFVLEKCKDTQDKIFWSSIYHQGTSKTGDKKDISRVDAYTYQMKNYQSMMKRMGYIIKIPNDDTKTTEAHIVITERENTGHAFVNISTIRKVLTQPKPSQLLGYFMEQEIPYQVEIKDCGSTYNNKVNCCFYLSILHVMNVMYKDSKNLVDLLIPSQLNKRDLFMDIFIETQTLAALKNRLAHYGYYLVICALDKKDTYVTQSIINTDLSLRPIYIQNINNNHFVAVTKVKIKDNIVKVPLIDTISLPSQQEDKNLDFFLQKVQGNTYISTSVQEGSLYDGYGTYTSDGQQVTLQLNEGPIQYPQIQWGIDHVPIRGVEMIRYRMGHNISLIQFIDGYQIQTEQNYFMYRKNTGFGEVDLHMYEKLIHLHATLAVTHNNKLLLKHRFLENFYSQSREDHKMNVQDDIYLELDYTLEVTIRQVQYDMQKCNQKYHDYMVLKPEWFLSLGCLGNYLNALKMTPKDNEELSLYIRRLVITSHECPDVIFYLLAPRLDRSSVKIAKLLLHWNNKVGSAMNDLLHMCKEWLLRWIRNIYARTPCFKVKVGTSIAIHKTSCEMYNIQNTSTRILQDIKFYDPMTRQRIYLHSGEEIYNYYSKYCECHKNIGKDQISKVAPQQDFYIAQYGKCVLNAIGAVIYRQTASLLTHSLTEFENFTTFYKTQNVPQKFIKCFKSQFNQQDYTSEKYFEHVRSCDKQKEKLYQQGKQNVRLGDKIKKIMSCFSKVGEFFLLYFYAIFDKISNRARNICSPDSTLLGTCNHINYIGLGLLKKVYPSYCSFLNNDQLEDEIYKGFLHMKKYGKTRCVSADFSSHDSNQFAQMINLVDNSVWTELLPVLWPLLDLPDNKYKEVLSCLTDTRQKLEHRMRTKFGYNKVFSLTMNGTVTSGHPTRTTFGNSLRVILYYQYIFKLANIQHYRMYVGGDDFYAIILDKDYYSFNKTVSRIFSSKPYGVKGLGQCTKKVNDLGEHGIDFLSKLGCYYQGAVYIFRNFERIAYLQPFSNSRVNDASVLRQAACCAMFGSGYDLNFIKALCSHLGDFQTDMDKYKFGISIAAMNGNQPNRAQYYQTNYRSYQKNSSLDMLYKEIVLKIGDLSGKADKYQLQGMCQDVRDNNSVGWYQTLFKYNKQNYNINVLPIKQRINQVGCFLHSHSQNLSGRMVGFINILYVFFLKYANVCVGSLISGTQKYIINKQQTTPEKPDENFDLYTHTSSEEAQITSATDKWSQVDARRQTITNSEFKKPIGSTKELYKMNESRKNQQKKKVDQIQNQKINQLANQVKSIKLRKNVQQTQLQQFKKKNKRKAIAGQKGNVKYTIETGQKNISLRSPYVRSILLPFKTKPIKPFYDYPLNTSIVETTLEYNFNLVPANGSGITGSSGYGAAVAIFPHAFNAFKQYESGTQLSNVNLVNIFNQGLGTSADVQATYLSPLDAYQGYNNTIGARWTSARVIRCGVRLLNASPTQTRAGIIQIVQVPGRDQSLYSGYYINPTTIPFPNAQQIKTYSTSYENMASVATSHDYAWIPTDAIDNVFTSDVLKTYVSSFTTQNTLGELEVLVDHLRNGMYVLITGATSQDQYRLEVKIAYEYIPTTSFNLWSSNEGIRATLKDQQDLKNVVSSTVEAQQSSVMAQVLDAMSYVGEGATNFISKTAQAVIQDAVMHNNMMSSNGYGSPAMLIR